MRVRQASVHAGISRTIRAVLLVTVSTRQGLVNWIRSRSQKTAKLSIIIHCWSHIVKEVESKMTEERVSEESDGSARLVGWLDMKPEGFRGYQVV